MPKFNLTFFTKDPSFPFFIQYGKHDDNLYAHTHEDFSELVIVLNGSATHVVNDERFLVRQGDVFVISNSTQHAYEDTDHFRLCNIMFRPEYLLESAGDLSGMSGFHALFICEPYFTRNYSFTSKLTLAKDEYLNVKLLTDRILSEYQNMKSGYKTAVHAEFIYLVTLLSRYYDQINSHSNKLIMSLAETVSYINNHFAEDLSIKELAQKSNYSARHFLRLFHDAYNASPTEYIMSLRLSNACTMLLLDQYSISEIALACGFSTPSYFCRVFKAHFGLTPGQYITSQNGHVKLS